MNKYHEINPDQIIMKQVNELYILWIIKKTCSYMKTGGSNSQKITMLQLTHGLLDAIVTLSKNNKKEFLHTKQKKFYEAGSSLFVTCNDRTLLDCSLAIKAALVIMESDSKKWKQALTQKILEAQKTIRQMAISIDKKRKKKSRKHANVVSSQNTTDQANISTNPTQRRLLKNSF